MIKERVPVYFNSILVQLEANCRTCTLLSLEYFNSILVQLEDNLLFILSKKVFLFQFHSGTIRSSFPSARTLLETYFNSILVQLEAEYLCKAIRFKIHFNSILVQLEATGKIGKKGLRLIFQFHSGTIRRLCGYSCNRRQDYFNSILVQLED